MTEGTIPSTADEKTLERIREVEDQIKRYCNFIPISNWGFDEDTLDFLRDKKHEIVDAKLSQQEKYGLSNFKKQKVARAMGTVCSSVAEVYDFLGREGRTNTLPTKVILKKAEKAEKVDKSSLVHKHGKPKEQAAQKDSKAEKEKEEQSDESEEEEEEKVVAVEKKDSNDKKKSKVNNVSPKNLKSVNDVVKKVSKPVAAVKPTPRKENSGEQTVSVADESNAAVEVSSEKPLDNENDSTDDEAESNSKSKNNKRKLPAKTDIHVKKSKIDKELEKFENIDVSTLDPIESRKVAMLKLQKKIELMKVSRNGDKQTREKNTKKLSSNKEEERKMKRRMSKLKGKQKRAQLKTEAAVEKGEVKPKVVSAKEEDLPRTEEGNIVYSKFDFIVKDDEKKKLSNAEKRVKFTGKNYKALLTKVENRDEKLAKLRETEPEKAKKMEEEIKWGRVLKKAEGVKVKDNVELLKKGIKKKEKMKDKQLKKWEDRVEKVKSEMSSKQDKRTTNIQKRIDDKKKKKLQKMRKKGRIL